MDEEDRGIKVYLRIRPSKSSSKYFLRDDLDENMITFKIPKLENLIVNNSRTLYNFKFHGILEQNATQEEVFNKVGKSAVQNILNGFNSTVFTYGQTGSGKTFTITGGPARYADRGIIPRSISTLFAEFQRRKDVVFSCHVSYLEIYNDKGYDLLSDEHSQITNLEEMRKVSILEDEEGGFHFRNLSVHPVTSEEEALNLLFLGDTNRAIGETAMNLTSSRSHCIFVLGLEARAVGSELVTRSKLNLVDLAGSERVHKTNSYGQTLNEAKAINSSLFFLEMVIVALQERDMHGRERTHIPYRNSMMTSVLRDSLGGNCKTLMIATISSETSQTDESISTCSFAQRVALVKNTASVNQELEPLLVIRRLKADIIKLREEIKFLKGESGDDGLITELQRDELNRAIKCYINDRDQRTELNIGSITITKLNEAFRLFKSIAQEMQQSAEGRPIQEDKTYSEESSVVDVEKNITKFQNTQPQRHDEVVDCNKDKDVIHHLRPLGIKPTKSDSSNDHNGFLLHQNQVVGGVNRCPDRAIVEDPAAAFLWFKTRYPGIKAIDENKDLLKEKYTEAKEVGESVQNSRRKIDQIKHIVEKLRRERAVKSLNSYGDSVADREMEEFPEEVEYLNAINIEKEVYQEGFNKLRQLKATIEHLQKLLEKGKCVLQADFEVWYSETCSDYRGVLDITNKALHAGKEVKKSEVVSIPEGIKLTGDKETDNDIIAFYKAKDSFISRSRRK